MKSSYPRLLIILLSLALLGLAAACQAAPTPTPQATEPDLTAEPVLPPTPSSQEAAAAILQALLALNTQPNRMEVTTLPEGGTAQTNIIEFLPPDRKHIASPEQGVEYIVIGDQVYVYTQTSGQWEATQIPAATFMGDQPVTEASLAATISEAKYVRTELVDGNPVIVYSYMSTTTVSELKLRNLTSLWVNEVDGLPVKMVTDGDILAAATDPASGESSMTAVPAISTTLIVFDPALSIEPPVK